MPFVLALFAHPTMLFALANLKRDAKAVWGWLCHRSFWQLMFGAALLLADWEYIGKRTEQRHANKSDAQLIKCSHRQQQLEAQSKVQQQQVTKVVDHYLTVTKPVVKTVVQRIESAPLPGNCGTPKEVSDADV